VASYKKKITNTSSNACIWVKTHSETGMSLPNYQQSESFHTAQITALEKPVSEATVFFGEEDTYYRQLM